MVKPLNDLVEALSRLPTIGRKSAWRLAFFMMEQDQSLLDRLAQCIGTIRQKVQVCRECFCYSETELCDICGSLVRDSSQICVVEKPTDIFAIEGAGRYRGLYHVLGGVLSPINGVTPDKLRIGELKTRVARTKPAELIMGLGGSGDAETTVLYLGRIFSSPALRITRLARGLPAGTDLDYIDQATLTQALMERTPIEYGEKRT